MVGGRLAGFGPLGFHNHSFAQYVDTVYIAWYIDGVNISQRFRAVEPNPSQTVNLRNTFMPHLQLDVPNRYPLPVKRDLAGRLGRHYACGSPRARSALDER